MISSLALTVENPLNDPNGKLVEVVNIVNYCTTAIFTVEAFIKIVANGFICNGKDSYLRNSTNILDFLIVIPSLVAILPFKTQLSFFKIIRIIRLLRPLRFIGKNENLRISI